MKVKIQGPQKVRGRVEAPPSKAYTHRALITSFLSSGSSTIENPLSSDDTQRTLEAIESLGATISRQSQEIKIYAHRHDDSPSFAINCGESGATLRFLTAVAAGLTTDTRLSARGSLANRPLIPLLDALRSLGASISTQGSDRSIEVHVRGPLRGGSVSIPGDISSQFISGLLLAAPLASDDVEIDLTTRLESRPYVDLTLAIMRMHRIEVQTYQDRFLVRAPQSYLPAKHNVPTDFSSAAFLLAAGITAGRGLELSKIRMPAIEPDSAILGILEAIGVRIERDETSIKVGQSKLDSFTVDAHDHPDLVPALEVLACQAHGRSEIQGVERLVHKESNRLQSIPDELRKMGARITISNDRLLIEGRRGLVGTELHARHDHRVAMACATAALAARGATTIDEAEAVSKSYPGFYEDLETLGVNLLVE